MRPMRRKKNAGARRAAVERSSSPSIGRPKTVRDDAPSNTGDVSELITSSARKSKFVHLSADVQVRDNNLVDGMSAVNAGCDMGLQQTSHSLQDTIFSPGFHVSETVGSAIADFQNFLSSNEKDVGHFDSLKQQSSALLDSEISMSQGDYECLSIEKESMLSSNGHLCLNLDCESYEESLSHAYAEANEDTETVEFNPYMFIRNLPDLSTVVPTFRSLLLPKQTRSCPSVTLVLDLDETLVHSSLEYCDDADFTFNVNFNLKEHTVYVRCRPHLMDFMEKVSSMFEIIVFTASQGIYAGQLLTALDPKRRIFRHRVFRESCVFVEGNYLKDLSVLGRDLARVAIIDNSPQAFGYQIDNGIPIESWFDDRSDSALLSLLPFLESLVGVDDVRPLIAKKFNLRKKVAGAIDPWLCPSKRTQFVDY